MFFNDIGSGLRSVGEWGQHAVEDTQDWFGDRVAAMAGKVGKAGNNLMGGLFGGGSITSTILMVGGLALVAMVIYKKV